MKEFDWSKEYSERADRLRKNRVEQSFYKYGSAADNFTMKDGVDAINTCDRCIKKYQETGNTEYLLDAMNYLMFEFMYPRKKNAYFKATDSGESAGICGTCVNDVTQDKKYERFGVYE